MEAVCLPKAAVDPASPHFMGAQPPQGPRGSSPMPILLLLPCSRAEQCLHVSSTGCRNGNQKVGFICTTEERFKWGGCWLPVHPRDPRSTEPLLAAWENIGFQPCRVQVMPNCVCGILALLCCHFQKEKDPISNTY